jgi:signal transduction histidine kinase
MPNSIILRRMIFQLVAGIAVGGLAMFVALTGRMDGFLSPFNHNAQPYLRGVGAALTILALSFLTGVLILIRIAKRLTARQTEIDVRLKRLKQLRQLNDASLVLASNMDLQPMLDRMCRIAQDITESDFSTLLLHSPSGETLQHTSHTGHRSASDPIGDIGSWAITQSVLSECKAVLVDDAGDQAGSDRNLAQSGIGSLMAVPVVGRSQTVGVLVLGSPETAAYDTESLDLISALTAQAAAMIENARLFDETISSARILENRARNLLMINRISADLTSLLDPYEIFNTTAKHMVELMEVDHCSIHIFGEHAAHAVVVAEYPEIGTVGWRYAIKENPALNRVLHTRKPFAVTDVRDETLIAPILGELENTGIRAILVVPLIARDQVMGTINLDVLHQPYVFSAEVQELCQTVAAQCAIAVANARLLYDTQQQSRALARKSQELVEESSRLDAVLANMADGLVVTDLEGRIILANPAFNLMTNHPLNSSFRGCPLNAAVAIEGLPEVIAQAISNPEDVSSADLNLPDRRFLRASASALRMKHDAGPVQGGAMMGVVTVLRDITHEVEVDRMKTEFISAVSHELRTPLTSILGFASLIQRSIRRRIAPLVEHDARAWATTGRILENLSIIETESKRLTRLINDVLDIAKMESGQLDWQMSEVAIGDVIENSVSASASLALGRGLAVKVDSSASLPPVWGDNDRLVQVMTNLLSNAIKFTEAGQISVRASLWTGHLPVQSSANVRVGIQPPAIIVEVTDTGVGISEDDLPFIFDRFRQVGDTLTGKPQGTGLGLPICKEIVEQHGGSIWVDSKPGVGSAFFFSLPLAAALLSEGELAYASMQHSEPTSERQCGAET